MCEIEEGFSSAQREESWHNSHRLKHTKGCVQAGLQHQDTAVLKAYLAAGEVSLWNSSIVDCPVICYIWLKWGKFFTVMIM